MRIRSDPSRRLPPLHHHDWLDAWRVYSDLSTTALPLVVLLIFFTPPPFVDASSLTTAPTIVIAWEGYVGFTEPDGVSAVAGCWWRWYSVVARRRSNALVASADELGAAVAADHLAVDSDVGQRHLGLDLDHHLSTAVTRRRQAHRSSTRSVRPPRPPDSSALEPIPGTRVS